MMLDPKRIVGSGKPMSDYLQAITTIVSPVNPAICAAMTDASRLVLVARSSLQTMPLEIDSPNRSAASDWIGRLPSR